MLRTDRYYRNLNSPKGLDLSSKFKIKLPNASSKRLTSYKSWRNFDGTGQKSDKLQKENIKIDCQETSKPINPTYLRFMKNFLKEKRLTNHECRKKSQNLVHQKSALDIRNYQQHETQFHNQNNCTIYVGQKMSSIKYRVSSVGNLVAFLKGKNYDMVGFKSAKNDLSLDFCLTLDAMDASFLNGKSIHLTPIYRKIQDTIDINSFEVLHCIGTGGFSKVFLVRFLQDGKLYAMKVISKQFIVKNKKKRIVINERNIMKDLNNHPFIVKMKFCFESRESLIFVMEYCPGGQLFNLVKKFRRMRQEVAKFYIIQTLLGLEKVHEERIIYRDFKPENILIDLDGHVRIADFGLAKPDITSNKDRATSFCGSPQYMPPEMIMKSGHSFPVDFYCIGALLYELVTGLPPFYNKDPNRIYQSTISETLSFPSHTSLSPEIKQLLLGLLQKDQKFRLGSLSGVKQVLAHPWFGKINRKEYLQKRIKPPVTFSAIEDFNFTFDQIKNDNQMFVTEMRRQQKDSSRKYQKIMTNFYYDYREYECPQSGLSHNAKGIKSVDSLSSTRESKRRHTNLLTGRSFTSSQKMRRQPISDLRMIYNNKVF